jgi:hypothetical protein
MSNRRQTLLLLALGLVQLVASTALLLWASTSRTPVPRRAGMVDVVLVFTLVLTSAAIGSHTIKRTGVPKDAGQAFWFLFLATLLSLVLMAPLARPVSAGLEYPAPRSRLAAVPGPLYDTVRHQLPEPEPPANAPAVTG